MLHERFCGGQLKIQPQSSFGNNGSVNVSGLDHLAPEIEPSAVGPNVANVADSWKESSLR